MGFLGTGAGIGKLFGKTLSRYTGMMVRGILNAPALSELLAFYDGNTDGETLHDTIVPANIVPEPDVVEVSCLRFSSSTFVETGVKHDFIQQTGVFEICFMAKRDNTTFTDRIFYPLHDAGSGLSGWRVQFKAGSDVLNIYMANNGVVIANNNFANTKDSTAWHAYLIVGNGTTVSLYVDGDLEGVFTMVTANFGGSQGRTTRISDTTNGLAGLLSDIYISDGTSVDTRYPFQEDSGLPQDVSDNGNHATANTATWTNDTTGVLSSYNLDNGFYAAVQGTPPYIPAIGGDAFDKVKGSIYAEVNPLLIGKTLAVEGQLYSASVPGVSYTRNAAFWGAGYDTSCISVHNSVSATTRRLTLVTQRHAVGATHYGGYAIGQTYGFLDMANNYYTRTIEAFSEIVGEDITVFQFDSDLPASVVPCKILPTNWESYLDLGPFSEHAYPTLATNQYNEGTIQELYYVLFGEDAKFQPPTRAEWLSMYKLPITGDSGNPTLLMQNGDTFLITLWWSDTGGSLYAAHIDEINAEISGFGSSYVLEEGTLTAIDVAANGLALTNPGGKVSNGSEVSFEMTDPSYLDTVQVVGGDLIAYNGLAAGKPMYGENYAFETEWTYPAIDASERVTDGDFGSGAPLWVMESDWTLNGTTIMADCSGTSNNRLFQGSVATIGRKYRVSFEVKNYVSGNVWAYLGNNSAILSASANGVYTGDIKNEGINEHIYFDNVSFVGSLDNVSVVEIAQVTVPVPPAVTGYDGRIKWFNSAGTLLSSLPFDDGDMSAMTTTLPSGGDYTCKITGVFPRIYFNAGGDREYITGQTNQGYTGMASLEQAFNYCENFSSVIFGDYDLPSPINMDSSFRSMLSLTSFPSVALQPSTLNKTFEYSTALKTVHVVLWDISLCATMSVMLQSVTLDTLGAGGLDEMISYFASEHREGRAPSNILCGLGLGTHSAASDADYTYLGLATGSGGAGWIITGGVLA